MEASSSTNRYPVKLENDQTMDSLTNVASGLDSPYHPVLGGVGAAQSHIYGGWNPQPQIQQTPISEYPYAYGQSTNFATSTQQYVDMYHQASPTNDSSLRPSAGNPVSVPVTLSAPLNSLGYPSFNGSSAQQQQQQQQSQQQQQHDGSGGGIPRPPSVVHSPMNEAFSSSRGRSTSFPGPYYFTPSMHPNTFSSIPPPPSGFSHPMARMSQLTAVAAETTNNQVHMTTKQGNSYYSVSGNGMTSPTSLDAPSSAASTPYDYMQEDQGMSTGNPHTQYRPITPGPGSAQVQQGMYSYITPAPQQQQLHQNHHQNQQQHTHRPLLSPISSLSSSVVTGGAPTIPRSMSMGNIPGNGGTLNPTNNTSSWFNSGLTAPSGILTPGSTLSLTPSAPALSRSTANRLGIIGPPSLTIPSSYLDHRPTSDYEMYSAGGSGASGGGVNGGCIVGGIGIGGSGPGTGSNGGSVPLTPTTDDTASFDYHHHIACAPGSGLGFPRAGGAGSISGYADGADEDEDNDDDDEDDKMTMALPPLSGGGGGANGSPRRCVGVTRTMRSRRSTAIAAGPSVAAAAAVGSTRSRSGTMVNGASSSAAVAAANAAVAAGMVPSNGLSGGSLTMSPVDMHGALSASMGLGMLVSPSSSSSSPVNGSSGSGGNNAGVGVVGGQANSPLAMKELSPDIKPTIEMYLNKYLNYLCMNPNAKDRMGHLIHQMYTARRIQRYEQLYGWRPLKFRIEAFVNGFVDLLTASGLSQDVTMKIPHYLNNSRLFSRFNESGNRMKSQGQTIWRVRARCRNDIPGVDAPAANGGFLHHASSAFSPQQQQQIQLHQQQVHHQQIQQQQQQVHHQHDGTTNGLMIAPDPLLWEFVPYARSIVGQPPLAIVGTAWQWNMKVHDHWTPRKKVSWSFSGNATSPDTGAASVHDGSDSSPPHSTSPSSPLSTTLPRWLSLQGSKLKGTPTESGVYPISIEATFQEDNDPEPVVVRGDYTIQVSKAIGGWKAKVTLPQDGVLDSPDGDHAGSSGDMGYGHESGSGRGLGGGHAESGHGMDDAFPSLIAERMDQLTGGLYGNQGSTSGFQGMSYTYAYAH